MQLCGSLVNKTREKLSKFCAFLREAQRISKKCLSVVHNGPLTWKDIIRSDC